MSIKFPDYSDSHRLMTTMPDFGSKEWVERVETSEVLRADEEKAGILRNRNVEDAAIKARGNKTLEQEEKELTILSAKQNENLAKIKEELANLVKEYEEKNKEYEEKKKKTPTFKLIKVIFLKRLTSVVNY